MNLKIESIENLHGNIPFISSTISGTSDLMKLKPDICKFLGFNLEKEPEVGKVILITDYHNSNYFPVNPQDETGWGLTGSDDISAYVMLGESNTILDLTKHLDEIIREMVINNSKSDLANFITGYLVYHLKSGNSVLIYYGDQNKVNALPESFLENDILTVFSGAHAYDLNITDIAMAAFVEEISNMNSSNELEEETIYNLEDLSDIANQFVVYKGQEFEDDYRARPILLELLKNIVFDILNYDFIDDELKKRLKRIEV